MIIAGSSASRHFLGQGTPEGIQALGNLTRLARLEAPWIAHLCNAEDHSCKNVRPQELADAWAHALKRLARLRHLHIVVSGAPLTASMLQALGEARTLAALQLTFLDACGSQHLPGPSAADVAPLAHVPRMLVEFAGKTPHDGLVALFGSRNFVGAVNSVFAPGSSHPWLCMRREHPWCSRRGERCCCSYCTVHHHAHPVLVL